MADSNGSDQARLYLDAVQAQLGERVTNLGRRQTDLEAEMRNGFRTIEQSIGTLSNSISERNKPNFQALGVMLTAMVVLGGLLYWPIREGQSRIDTTLTRLSEVMVTREELDWRAARGSEDRLRTDEALKTIRADLLPRAEWAERNLNRDHEIANLQRQVDLQRADFQTFASSLGNGRDFIVDLKTEVGRLRDQLAEIRARQYQRLGSQAP